MVLAPQTGDFSPPITQCVYDITDCVDGSTYSKPVHKTVCHPSLAGPGVDSWTLLAGPHVPHTRLVPQVTHLRLVAPGWSVLNHQC